MFDDLKFIESKVSLKEKSYYKMGGIARYFSTPANLAEVVSTINLAKKNTLSISILGSGSNCVFSDEFFDGVVISLEKLKQCWWESDDTLFVEAGVSNTEVANICLDSERKGASWMYLMPGQIGASVRMNARCYGGEMSKIVSQILTINTDGHLNTYSAQEIFHGYKSTRIMNEPEIVVGVCFHFPETESKETLLQHMKFCEENRNSKKHFLYPSCGSTFKNNYAYGKPSGQIFDELGMKGLKRGDAEVSQYHGNFIWNTNSAATKDMLSLSAHMRKSAQTKYNVDLNLEVQPIGSFTEQEFFSCGMENCGPYIQIKDKYITGLFHNPTHNTIPSLPKKIFSSFFLNYFHKKTDSLNRISVELIQLDTIENATLKEDNPFLQWNTVCEKNYKNVFSHLPNPGEQVEKLWEYSVSELFLSHPQTSEYLEIEGTPTQSSVMLEFEKERTRKKEQSKNTLKFVDLQEIDNNSIQFGYQIPFHAVKKLIFENTLHIQCALSLGNQSYWLAPYWSCENEQKADFHQPQKFFPIKLF